LISREDVDPAKIILFSRSVGGGAIFALARLKPSAAPILMSTFTSVQAMAAKFLTPKFLVRNPFDNLKIIKSYPGPVFVIHDQNDRSVPSSHGAGLHQAAKNSQLITYASGHNDCPPDLNQFWQDVELFLTEKGII
jgi:fermentation-respiration switch protein FrsA (DUF1100 family)